MFVLAKLWVALQVRKSCSYREKNNTPCDSYRKYICRLLMVGWNSTWTWFLVCDLCYVVCAVTGGSGGQTDWMRSYLEKKKNKEKTSLVGFERKETYRERQHDPDHSSLYIMSILPPTTCILAAFSLLYRWDKWVNSWCMQNRPPLPHTFTFSRKRKLLMLTYVESRPACLLLANHHRMVGIWIRGMRALKWTHFGKIASIN